MTTLNPSVRGLIESGALAHLVTEGGAPELLQRLAQTYVGPGTVFPPFPDPPAGYVTRIMPTRVSGAGPWAD